MLKKKAICHSGQTKLLICRLKKVQMIIKQAREVLKIEAQSILGLVEKVGPEFERAVDLILKAKGRVILTGMGKSGLIGRKISATLNSTGTPSLFLHPAEAIHGDLGMVTSDDIVIAISNSGQTMEINTILPMLGKIGARIISFTGGLDSPMAKASDIVIDVGVEREACPLGMAPTASTTAALAMGDALAVALINRRRFNLDDFKKFHPGGSLGERLAIKVKEVMLTRDRIPMVLQDSKVGKAIEEINAKKLGATLVVNKNKRLVGIVTDGDLRRALTTHKNIHAIDIKDIMSPSAKTINENQTAAQALELMELNAITHLVILDKKKRIKGLVHLHDLLGREEFKANGSINPTTGAYR
jgi:arabinose-5-phosphate isomerase